MEHHDTPPRGRRIPSAEAISLANLALALDAIGLDCAETAKRLDELEGDARRSLLSQLAQKLGEIGDLAHEARRAVKGLGL